MKSEGEKRLGEPRGSQMAPDGFREVPSRPRRPPTRTSQHLHTLRQYIYIVYLSPRCMPYCTEVSTTLSLSLSLFAVGETPINYTYIRRVNNDGSRATVLFIKEATEPRFFLITPNPERVFFADVSGSCRSMIFISFYLPLSLFLYL